jgi:hypothetical protein
VTAFLSPIPGWTVKSGIRRVCYSHIAGTVARSVGVVALNALSVSRQIREGRPARPPVVRVGVFLGSRLPVERASYESERGRGRTVSYVYGIDRRIRVRGTLIQFFRGFSGRRCLEGLFFLIVDFGYPNSGTRQIILRKKSTLNPSIFVKIHFSYQNYKTRQNICVNF